MTETGVPSARRKVKRERTRLYQLPGSDESPIPLEPEIVRPARKARSVAAPVERSERRLPVPSATSEVTAGRAWEAERVRRAEDIVKRYMCWSAGAGALIPAVALDFVAVSALQLLMLRRLTFLYGVPFSRDLGKSLIASVVGGMPVAKASILKAIPILGYLTGAAAVSGVAAASTYAVGRVFIQHFESGGTLLTFRPEKMKEHYEAEFRVGGRVSPARGARAEAPGRA